mmetsp:Transcript_51031/g.123060  ORF Transcript_51031/g.123060 Transcript_51031/m.123060 type:complete len:124 (-) Transcript_51031:1949-2320(-)
MVTYDQRRRKKKGTGHFQPIGKSIAKEGKCRMPFRLFLGNERRRSRPTSLSQNKTRAPGVIRRETPSSSDIEKLTRRVKRCVFCLCVDQSAGGRDGCCLWNTGKARAPFCMDAWPTQVRVAYT